MPYAQIKNEFDAVEGCDENEDVCLTTGDGDAAFRADEPLQIVLELVQSRSHLENFARGKNYAWL